MEKQLPKNWVETTLGEVSSKPQYGWTSKSSDSGNIRYLRTTDLSKPSVIWDNVPFCTEEPDDLSKYLLEHNDILISRAGSVGLSYRVDNPPANVVFASYLIRFKPYIDTRIVGYYLHTLAYWEHISDMSAGIAVQNVNAPKLSSLKFPLPPLAEQERIAEKLDALFGQLDSVRGSMSRIPTLLANLRQQILTHAVTGKLTAHKGNIHILAKHLRSIKYGTSKKSDYDISDGIPVLRIPNIKDGKIDITDLKYSLFDPKEYQLLRLSKGDILVIRSNGSISLVGQSAIVDNNCDGFCYAGYLIRLRFNNDILPDFINYSFRSEFVRKQIVDLAHSTSGVNNINAQQIQNLSFVYFGKPEQEEIVNRVQSLFEKLDSIEQRYQMLKTKLENLPQAILHIAFKGELVEQLPSDGNATDLLREIEQLKKSLKKK